MMVEIKKFGSVYKNEVTGNDVQMYTVNYHEHSFTGFLEFYPAHMEFDLRFSTSMPYFDVYQLKMEIESWLIFDRRYIVEEFKFDYDKIRITAR